MSDLESSDDEGNGGFVIRKKYTIVLLDATVSMQNDGSFKSCMQHISKIYSELETFNYLWKFNCGVIALSVDNDDSVDHCDVLIDIKSSDTKKLKTFENYTSGGKIMYLKEGLEQAVDLFYKQKINKNDVKTIILITNNPKPLFEDEREVIASGRLLKRNMVEFLLVPTDTELFRNSKFYELFFKQLDENMCEMIKTYEDYDETVQKNMFDVLCELLSPPEQRTKIRLFLDKYNYMEMIQHNVFRAKYAPFKKAIKTESGDIKKVKQEQGFKENSDIEPVLKIKLVNDDNDEEPQTETWFKHSYDRVNEFGVQKHKAVVKQSELDELASICKEPKNNELALMYLGKEPKSYVVSAKFKSRLIKSTREKKEKMKFQIMWHHCVDNKKVIYCYMLGKNRLVAILKPTLFKNNPVFIKYTLGWSDNYLHSLDSLLPITKEMDNNEPQINELMRDVIQKLKTDKKSFLDIRDPKIVFEEALTRAKINKTSFQPPEDTVSMKYQQVDEKIGNDLLAQFSQL